MRSILFALTLFFIIPISTGDALAASPNSTRAELEKNAALHALFESEWQRGLKDSPENASYSGDTRYNDLWSDLSLKAISAREAADRSALEKLKRIDRNALSATDQLNYDTFSWQLAHNIERQKFREYLMPITHQGGVQTADGIVELLDFRTEKAYVDWLARLRTLPTLIDQNIALMQEGIKTKRTPPRAIMERVPGQIAAQIVSDPEQSAFYKPFKRMPDSIPEQRRAELQSQAVAAIRTGVIPAYRKLELFFNKQYLPATRTAVAASSLPNGKAYYDFLARYYTTTELSAEAIHTLGLSEVARIKAKMEIVKTATGFKGTLNEFFDFLRTDKQFFYKTPADLLEGYQALTKRIDPELVKVFTVLPRLTYGVKAIPDNIAPDTTTAYYQPGANDGSRAGYYYVNLYRPEVRPKWEMLPLSLHEAVPGHHFQFSRGLELPELPIFRRTAYFVAYGEGWGLYAEQLGYDMGLYNDPYDQFGQLTYEMWRAVRLVVDTGMHAKGWSRQQAIDYFKANAPKTEQDIVNEIDRYIGTPGQALGYKIGQLKISELRQRASEQLGKKFDLRRFNDEVLGTGSVPLEALEQHIDAWIAGQVKGSY